MADPAYYFEFATKFTQEGYVTFVVETSEKQEDPRRYGPKNYYLMTPTRFKDRVKEYILSNFPVTGITALEYERSK